MQLRLQRSIQIADTSPPHNPKCRRFYEKLHVHARTEAVVKCLGAETTNMRFLQKEPVVIIFR
jgi:hypothetical protein